MARKSPHTGNVLAEVTLKSKDMVGLWRDFSTTEYVQAPRFALIPKDHEFDQKTVEQIGHLDVYNKSHLDVV